ncbi:MAG: type II secretion system protein GspJ [bacterium]|nr:type II secretion system protein GspJ [bacterium]
MKERGFTLIEVMVSIFILSMIALVVWQATGSNIQAKERAEKRDQVFESASMVLGQMNDELIGAHLYMPQGEETGKSPSGEILTKTIFLGEDRSEEDALTFSAFSNVRYLKDSKESDQAEISYFLKRSEEGDQYSLMKRTASPPDADPKEGGNEFSILDDVEGLNFRYYDPKRNEWLNEWNSEGIDFLNKMPRAVEISLKVRHPSSDEEGEWEPLLFKTVVLLEMAPGPNDF